MRNEQVIIAWISGRPAGNGRGSLTTDGVNLLSYDLVIAQSLNGQGQVFDYTASGEYYSQTTSKHVGLALRLSGFELSAPKTTIDGLLDQRFNPLSDHALSPENICED